ncbi:MAG: DUF2779 domain-containing protein [Candidatus Eremiobacterota bacterium]
MLCESFTDYEEGIIRELIELSPELSEELNHIIERLVDLEKIIRENYYHPDFHGRTSLKITLPVLVPEMTYEPVTSLKLPYLSPLKLFFSLLSLVHRNLS